jgi:hypothetical protein
VSDQAPDVITAIIKYQGKPLDEESRHAMEDAVKALASTFNVPVPRVVFHPNVDLCSVDGHTTSCTVVDPQRRNAVIYYALDYVCPSTLLHEFYHHLASFNPEAAKAYGLTGDADSEEEANMFALALMNSIGINSGTSQNTPGMTQEVMHQMGTDIFDKLSEAYGWYSRIVKVNTHDLNLEYTPPLFEKILDDIYAWVGTPLGETLLNLISFGVLAGVSTLDSVGDYDRKFLNEWAANHLWEILDMAKPANMGGLMAQARAFGAAVGAMNGKAALDQLFYSPEVITQRARSTMDTLQMLVQSATKGSATPEQKFQAQQPVPTGVRLSNPFQ